MDRDTLRQAYLFNALDDDGLDALVAGARGIDLEAGEVLFEQDRPAQSFFLVERGQVRLYRASPAGDEKVIELLRSGETFAEAIMFMAGEGRYPVSAAAVEPSRVVAFDNEAYRALLAASPETALAVMGVMARRLHMLVAEIDRLTLHGATYRLVDYLLDQLPTGVAQSPSVRLTTPKQVIASRLSIKPETFSRILGRLSERGLIQVDGANIVLHDVAALRSLVDEAL